MTGKTTPISPAGESATPEDTEPNLVAAQRREQLLAAATRLIERSGSRAVSMLAIAKEAGVSVGLIYRYYDSKETILLSIIEDVLTNLLNQVTRAIAEAGPDPVRQVAAALEAAIRETDQNRISAVLSYRETRALNEVSRARIKDLELQDLAPIVASIRAGVRAGVLHQVDPELAAYDAMVLAHTWALKHWYFARKMSLETYITRQQALFLRALIRPEHHPAYADLLG
ncbi:TetR/AcrR family transcriptional regulator [Granulicoccus phenolivorans]|uniref:TetR/AcrR family transcriptional regulator n=1 Tax=Granulicoccus phenolivorans TaxID=266854 RepID=UPI0009DBA5D4|nr:TetR/AcrR family transcriptional regulator [Granulicoccus phenolivorans]